LDFEKKLGFVQRRWERGGFWLRGKTSGLTGCDTASAADIGLDKNLGLD
jgi:hypothetical protein